MSLTRGPTRPLTRQIAGPTRGANQAPPGSPINTGKPEIRNASGQKISTFTVDGSTLYAFEGTWTNSPTSYTYEWRISGVGIVSTASSYTPQPADQGKTLALTVRAINAASGPNGNYANADPVSIAAAAPVAGSAVQNYTFGTSTPTTIPLSFDPPATGTTPFTYRIEYRLTSSSGAWTVATSNLSATSYTVTGLAPDTSYSIRIIPQNAAGDGTSTSKSRTTATAATKPATMAAPSLSSTANSIAVTRAAAPADGGSAITGYDLQYRTGAGAWTVVAMNANPQTISGLTASTTYEVQTRAVNAIGPGDWSPSASIATQAAATAPAQMAAPSLVAGNQSIAVTRAAAPNDGGSPITGYDILYRMGSGAFTPVAMTSNPQTLTGLLNGQVYEVQTRANNAVGNGTPSPSATATPAAPATVDPDAANYFTAAQDAGTPVPEAQKARYDTLYKQMKAQGVYDWAEGFFATAADSALLGRRDLIMPSRVLSVTNSPAFEQNRGFMGDGAAYFGTGLSDNVAVKFQQDSATMLAWVNIAANGPLIGTNTPTFMRLAASGGTFEGRIHSATLASATGLATMTGLRAVTRDTATSQAVYENGVARASNTATSQARAAAEIQFYRTTGIGVFGAGRCAVLAFGGALTPSQHQALYTILNDFLSPIGSYLMPQLPFFIMTAVQAARFRDETAGDLDRLDPREVAAGPYKGKFVLPERVVFDPAHEARHDALRMLEVVAIDPEIAWPDVEVQRAAGDA